MTDHEQAWSSTLTLLTRARAGDPHALNDLLGRYIPSLNRWARGRLPVWARDLADTQDLVQETLVRTFTKLEGFDHRGPGALQAYLRQALMNRIRDELRKADRRPVRVELDEQEVDPDVSPHERAVGTEAVERYEAALGRLTDEERELIIARVELGLTYSALARAVGKPSSDAARMAVSRALLRLAEEMHGSAPMAD